MQIQYLNGPLNGEMESVVQVEEEKGVPIYITESGKQLSNNDLNKVFRIVNDNQGVGAVDLAELGDPSLVDNEAEFHADTSNKVGNEQKKPENRLDAFANKAEKTANTQPKQVQKPASAPQPSAPQGGIVDQLLSNAKRSGKTINLKLKVNVPTKEFYDLINKAIEISDEEFVEKVMQNMDLGPEVYELIKKEIASIYNPPKPKTTRKPRSTPKK